jgi:REP element-mobilizing transposase RayT
MHQRTAQFTSRCERTMTFSAASTERFRLLQFPVQHDHVHLIVEANDTQSFVRGLQGLAIRVARACNRMLGRRGAVWGDRITRGC